MNRRISCSLKPNAFRSTLVVSLRIAAHVAALTTFCSLAWAQAESTLPRRLLKEESEADRQFYEGKQKAGEQKWLEALRLFERAWNLKPSYDIAGNLGHVALKLGLYTKAATYLDRCLHMFPATGSNAQRLQVESLFREASVHVTAARFKLASKSGELILDRVVELGSTQDAQGTVYVNPGTHIVQVRQDGKVVVEQSFLAVANASLEVHVGMGDDSSGVSPLSIGTGSSSVASAGSRTSSYATQSRSAVPIILGASISAASFIAAGALLNSATNSMDHADTLNAKISGSHERCSGPTPAVDCGDLKDALERADRNYNWSYAMLGAGGVSLAATLVYGFWPTRDRQSSKATVLERHLPIEVQSVPGTGMVTINGSF